MMKDDRMTCAECDELLSGYFEDDLEPRARAEVEAHAAGCARCHGLVRDIDGIRSSAAALSDLAPSRDLWQGIEARIQPSVVSIAAPRGGARISRRWLAAAAAGLVIATSGVTYLATASFLGAGRDRAGQSRPAVQTERVAGATIGAPSAGQDPATPERAGAAEVTTGAGAPVLGGERAPRNSYVGLASRVAAPPATASELALSGEIARLQAVLRERRTELDATTVKVVEDNLALIDLAVRQARAALARDPASGFLSGQLDNALQKKVNLLRTVAMLPSST